MSDKYSKIDFNDFYFKFYYIVNNIIYEIHNNNETNKYLLNCNYNNINNTKDESIRLPLTICLGGGGFILYNYIFKNEKLIKSIELSSYDYDLSFSLKSSISKDYLMKFIKDVKLICSKSLEHFKYKNINNKNFEIYQINHPNRLHLRIDFNPYNNKNNLIHVLELSFWFNGKVSDNFTITDFNKTELFLYKYNDVYFYLLPLELLVKTMLYAIIDYFEKRNFNKCNKYIERIKFIKDINDIFMTKHNNNYNFCINRILSSYKNLIKRKYKIINDYPFILSKKFATIKNNGIIKCIYRDFRIHNHKELDNLIEKFINDCKDEKEYDYKDSDITIYNTDDESDF